MERYTRNRLYISPEEQNQIKTTKVLIAGCGIGSNIAECALRFGFENITIVDGDDVELSNLNRQNYVIKDINKPKVKQLYDRLKRINPSANIEVVTEFITEENLKDILYGHSIAINALDFVNHIPLIFDKSCQQNRIFVLHPYDLGWGGLVTVIKPDGLSLNILNKNLEAFNELDMVEYASTYLRFWNKPKAWLEDIIEKYKSENKKEPPPQLAVASWIVAGMCTKIMYNIITNKPYKIFPEFYIMSLD